ncbi:hypothetical protein Tco_1258882 [Tanacetum coccineum]
MIHLVSTFNGLSLHFTSFGQASTVEISIYLSIRVSSELPSATGTSFLSPLIYVWRIFGDYRVDESRLGFVSWYLLIWISTERIYPGANIGENDLATTPTRIP